MRARLAMVLVLGHERFNANKYSYISWVLHIIYSVANKRLCTTCTV